MSQSFKKFWRDFLWPLLMHWTQNSKQRDFLKLWSRDFSPGSFALRGLGGSGEMDLTLDVGSLRVYDQVQKAHYLVTDHLTSAYQERPQHRVVPDRLRQEDSRIVLGN